jgi:hypothetical protein
LAGQRSWFVDYLFFLCRHLFRAFLCYFFFFLFLLFLLFFFAFAFTGRQGFSSMGTFSLDQSLTDAGIDLSHVFLSNALRVLENKLVAVYDLNFGTSELFCVGCEGEETWLILQTAGLLPLQDLGDSRFGLGRLRSEFLILLR